MAELTKRETYLLYVLGMIFPIYPAMLLDEIRNGNISVLRISIIPLVNAWLLRFFFKKGLKVKIAVDIEGYLSAHYSEEDQKGMILNYKRYKSRFFQNTPLFTLKSLRKDPNLRIYLIEVFRSVLKLWGGGALYLAILCCLFYVVIWEPIIAAPF